MKINVVTSIYRLRKSRSLEFYLNPGLDIIKNIENSKINLTIYTNIKDNLLQNNNVKVKQVDFDELISFFWNDKEWRKSYSNALKSRSSKKFEEKNIPELLAIWLGKFEMMHRESVGCDKVLWMDSGIRTYLFNRNTNKYKTKKINIDHMLNSIESIFNDHEFAFLRSDLKEPFHGISMQKYNDKKLDLCRGGYILASSNQTLYIKEQIKYFWNFLISRNEFGTEENPLTMFYWSNFKQSILFDLDEWYEKLDMDLKNRLKLFL